MSQHKADLYLKIHFMDLFVRIIIISTMRNIFLVITEVINLKKSIPKKSTALLR